MIFSPVAFWEQKVLSFLATVGVGWGGVAALFPPQKELTFFGKWCWWCGVGQGFFYNAAVFLWRAFPSAALASQFSRERESYMDNSPEPCQAAQSANPTWFRFLALPRGQLLSLRVELQRPRLVSFQDPRQLTFWLLTLEWWSIQLPLLALFGTPSV